MNSEPIDIIYVDKPGWVAVMKCNRCKRFYDLRSDGQKYNTEGCPFCREELKWEW